jgi:hypothetical protein
MMSARTWKALTVVGACVMLSGCYSCSLNGGWERQMNPFCVERGALVGAAPMSVEASAIPPTGRLSGLGTPGKASL